MVVVKKKGGSEEKGEGGMEYGIEMKGVMFEGVVGKEGVYVLEGKEKGEMYEG